MHWLGQLWLLPVPPGSIAAPAEQSNPRYWKSWQVHSMPRIARAFKIPYVYDYIIKLWMTQEELILNHVNSNARRIGQG
jgi:hypothetical protein